MKYRYILFIAALTLLSVDASAQRKGRKVKPDTALIVKNYMDSLALLRKQLDSVQQMNLLLRKESSDGRYYRLFAPTTFYHSGAQKAFSFVPKEVTT